jgi:VanZ family protein
MQILRGTLKAWVPPVIWMLMIFSASGDAQSTQHSSLIFEPIMRWLFPQISQVRMDEVHFLLRKCMHLAEFAVLAGLFWWSLRQTKVPAATAWRWADAGRALVLVVLYAASDEIHQAFVPSRTGHFADVLVDTAGGVIGLGLLWLAGKTCKRW